MTAMEIAKKYDLMPKDVNEFIQTNATFRYKRNFQTGDIMILDEVDIDSFIAPLVQKAHSKELAEAERKAQQEREEAEKKAQQTKKDAELILQKENQERQDQEREHAVSIEKLKKTGAEGYYQYKVVSLQDSETGLFFRTNTGRVNTAAMMEVLNKWGMEGWHLVTAYSNEVGHNSQTTRIGSFASGTNATVDENILIFERFVRF